MEDRTSSITHLPGVMVDGAGQHILDGIRTVLFDCDGVLWRGIHAIDGAAECVRKLRESGRRCLFVSNNSSRTFKHVHEKLHHFGISDVRAEEVVTSAIAAATFLAEKTSIRQVLMIGSPGLRTDLEARGIRVVEAATALYPLRVFDHSTFVAACKQAEQDVDTGAVVVGWHPHADYHQVALGSAYLQTLCLSSARSLDLNADQWRRYGVTFPPTVTSASTSSVLESTATAGSAASPSCCSGDRTSKLAPGSAEAGARVAAGEPHGSGRYEHRLYVATNTDINDSVEGGYLIPGSGAIIASLTTAVQRSPVDIGKPSYWMADFVKDRCGADLSESLMVGDKMATDILFGNRCGFRTCLVLSGCDTEADLQRELRLREKQKTTTGAADTDNPRGCIPE
eukprot:GHVU01235522.1.p1 GENE.GHVU01235522.1~~GHVU01235522.1.p1  ORF type:complete len:397 (+),score=43.54 GHVU01235522.1:100-1290(+)